jgi:hypothetical protein
MMNKIKNPIKIELKGSTAGYEASEWCSNNLVFEDWDMWIGNHWSHYIFEFANTKDATFFALRWGQYA